MSTSRRLWEAHSIIQYEGKASAISSDPPQREGKPVIRAKSTTTKNVRANEQQPSRIGNLRNEFTDMSMVEPHSRACRREVGEQRNPVIMSEQYRMLWTSMKSLEAQLIHIGQASGIDGCFLGLEKHADDSYNCKTKPNNIDLRRYLHGESGKLDCDFKTDIPNQCSSRERTAKETDNLGNEALQRRSCVGKAMEYHMEQRSTESIGDVPDLADIKSTSKVSLIEQYIRQTTYDKRPSITSPPSREDHRHQVDSRTTAETQDFCGMMDCMPSDSRGTSNASQKVISSREKLLIYHPDDNSNRAWKALDQEEEEYVDIVQQYNSESDSMMGQSCTSGTNVQGGSSTVQVDIVVNDKYLSRLAHDMHEKQRQQVSYPRKDDEFAVHYVHVPEKQHRIMNATNEVKDFSVNAETPSVMKLQSQQEQEQERYESIDMQTVAHPGPKRRLTGNSSWNDDETQECLLCNYQEETRSPFDLKKEMVSDNKRACDPNLKKENGYNQAQSENIQCVTLKGNEIPDRRKSEERNRNKDINAPESLRPRSEENAKKDNKKVHRSQHTNTAGNQQRSIPSRPIRGGDKPLKVERSKRSTSSSSEEQHNSDQIPCEENPAKSMGAKSSQKVTRRDANTGSQDESGSKEIGQIINSLGNTIVRCNCAQSEVLSDIVPSMYSYGHDGQSNNNRLTDHPVGKSSNKKKIDAEVKDSSHDQYEGEKSEKLSAESQLRKENITERQEESNHCLTGTYDSTTDSHVSASVLHEETPEVLPEADGKNHAQGEEHLLYLPTGWSQLVDTQHGCIWTWDGKTLSPGFDLKAGVEKLLIDHLQQRALDTDELNEKGKDSISRISREVEQELRSKLCEYNKAFLDNDTLTRLIDLKNELKNPLTSVSNQDRMVHTTHDSRNHDKGQVVRSPRVKSRNNAFDLVNRPSQNIEKQSLNQPLCTGKGTTATVDAKSPCNIDSQMTNQCVHKGKEYSTQSIFKKPLSSPVQNYSSRSQESQIRTSSDTSVKDKNLWQGVEVKPERKLCHQEYVALTGPVSLSRHSPLPDLRNSGGESSLHVTYLNPWIKDWTTQSENEPPVDHNKSKLRTEKAHTKSLESDILSGSEKKCQFRSDWTMTQCSSIDKKPGQGVNINDICTYIQNSAFETHKSNDSCVTSTRSEKRKPFIKARYRRSISPSSCIVSKSSLGTLKGSSKQSLSSLKSRSDCSKKCIVGKVKNYNSSGDIEIEIELSHKDLEKLLIQRQKQKRKRLSSAVLENGRSKALLPGCSRTRTPDEEKQVRVNVEEITSTPTR